MSLHPKRFLSWSSGQYTSSHFPLTRCVNTAKLLFILRAFPAWKQHVQLDWFHVLIRQAVRKITNLRFLDEQWLQIRLGRKSAVDVALTAYLPSTICAASLFLSCRSRFAAFGGSTLNEWVKRTSYSLLPLSHSTLQQRWDEILAGGSFQILVELACVDKQKKARLFLVPVAIWQPGYRLCRQRYWGIF